MICNKERFNWIVLVLFIIGLNSCNSKKSQFLDGFKISNIKVENVKELEYRDFIDTVKYILLEDIKESRFSQITKVSIKNNHINILDASGVHQVLVFDLEGNYIRSIGTRGKGPGEYLRLCDFDIDKKNNYHLYDAQHKRILIYNSNGVFIEQLELEYRPDGMVITESEKYMFSIPFLEEDKAYKEEYGKLILTDLKGRIEKILLSSDRRKNNKGNSNVITKSNDLLIFSKPVTNSIFTLNKNDSIEEMIRFDFMNKNVPDEIRSDYSEVNKYRLENECMYFESTPVKIKNYLIANVFSGANRGVFVFDFKSELIKTQIYSLDNFSHKNINYFVGHADNCLISYLDIEGFMASKDKDLLCTSAKNHLTKGGMLLSLFVLK